MLRLLVQATAIPNGASQHFPDLKPSKY